MSDIDIPFISDLRREFYGGSTVDERNALLAAKQAGIKFDDMVAAATSVRDGGASQGTTVDVQASIGTHNGAGDAHLGVVRWKTAGKNDDGIYMQTATPPVDAGCIWFEI